MKDNRVIKTERVVKKDMASILSWQAEVLEQGYDENPNHRIGFAFRKLEDNEPEAPGFLSTALFFKDSVDMLDFMNEYYGPLEVADNKDFGSPVE